MAGYPDRRAYPSSGPRGWEHSYTSYHPLNHPPFNYPPPSYYSSASSASSGLNFRESRAPVYHRRVRHDHLPLDYMHSYERPHHRQLQLTPFTHTSATHTRPPNQWTNPYNPRPTHPPTYNTYNPTSQPYVPVREPYRPAIYPGERTSYGISPSQRHYYSQESYVRAEAPAPAPSMAPRAAHHDSGWPPWDFSTASPRGFGEVAGPARSGHMKWSSSPTVVDRSGYAERAGSLEPRATGTVPHGLPSFKDFEQGVSPGDALGPGGLFEQLFPSSPPRQTQDLEPAQLGVQLFTEDSPRYHTSEISTPPPHIKPIPDLSPESNPAHHTSPSPRSNPNPTPPTLALPSATTSAPSTPSTVTERHPSLRGPVKVPVTFETVAAHTAKCDLCNGRNSQGMTRCRDCGWQCCHACAGKNGHTRTHVLAGGSRVHVASSPSSSAGRDGDEHGDDDDSDSDSDSEGSSRVGGVRPRLRGEAVASVTRRQTRSWTRRNAARVEDAAVAAAAAVAAVGVGGSAASVSRSETRSESESPAREFSIQEGPSEEVSMTLSLGGGESSNVYGGGTVPRVSSDVMDGARSLYDLSISALCRQGG
ncbi:hypothetical protein P168DRAFT_305511 [Aspergillus campestris IBT 28561]|uniref:Uncharacterized protein n=1 Tax=Aspergillus campestris (strain IBT 28561) TaxID=1392248 RepID=A0A2I1CZY4_ASPC2|nr:uncharacterized protein P168DRAFT_305511 [Aspergillus campestris IBT 28561]PKY03192.1 hypothetical protein P168DRAFT_305511 [Aspergillus campestris IBT 28561]